MCDPLSSYMRDTDAFRAALWQLKPVIVGPRDLTALLRESESSHEPFDVRVLLYADSDWIPLVLFLERRITNMCQASRKPMLFS